MHVKSGLKHNFLLRSYLKGTLNLNDISMRHSRLNFSNLFVSIDEKSEVARTGLSRPLGFVTVAQPAWGVNSGGLFSRKIKNK